MTNFATDSRELELNSWVALWDHQPEVETGDELSFRAGDVITVLDREHEDWWLGSLDGRTGLFPVTYGQLTGPRFVENEENLAMENKVLNDHISERPGRFYFSEPLYPLSLPETHPSSDVSGSVDDPVSPNPDRELLVPGIIDPFKTPNRSQTSLPMVGQPLSPPNWNQFTTEAELEQSDSVTSGEIELVSALLADVQLNTYSTNEDGEAEEEILQLDDSIPLAPVSTVPTIDSNLGLNLNQELVAKQGFLSVKSGVSDFGPLTSTKHWKQYHLTLYANYLLIFRAEDKSDCKRLKGYFDLHRCQLELDNDKLSKKKLVFALHLRSSLKPLFLADTVTNFNRWVEAIRNQVHRLQTLEIEEIPDLLPSLRRAMLGVHKTKSHRRSLSLSKEQVPTLLASEGGEGSKVGKKGLVTKLFHKTNHSSTSTTSTGTPNSLPIGNRSQGFWYTLAVQDPSCPVAYVVTKCVQALQRLNCLDQEGIYRLSGNATTIKSWKEKFVRGVVDRFDERDPTVITSLLKLYLRELHQPLLPPNLYLELTEASGIADYDSRLMQQKSLLHTHMDPIALTTLHYLVDHLAQIGTLSDLNKMDPGNLAIVFTPTLARQPEDLARGGLSQVPSLKVFHNLIETLLIQSQWFFEKEEDSPVL